MASGCRPLGCWRTSLKNISSKCDRGTVRQAGAPGICLSARPITSLDSVRPGLATILLELRAPATPAIGAVASRVFAGRDQFFTLTPARSQVLSSFSVPRRLLDHHCGPTEEKPKDRWNFVHDKSRSSYRARLTSTRRTVACFEERFCRWLQPGGDVYQEDKRRCSTRSMQKLLDYLPRLAAFMMLELASGVRSVARCRGKAAPAGP